VCEEGKIGFMAFLQTSIDKILADLTEPQRDAVTHGEGPLLVAAGPGSGKTRVITHRIAYLVASGVSPWAILAVTFTNKAADEMRRRVKSLCGESRPWMLTFHSFCARVLRSEAPLIGYPPAFTIYDAADSKTAVQRALKRLEIDSTSFPPSAVAQEISSAKTRLLAPEDYAAQAGDYRSQTIARIYKAYQQTLKDAGGMDFDDLLNHTLLLFRQHPEALSRLRNRFRHVLIDEFQDTNLVQFELANTLAGANGNICVVGDIDQSIYTWRGAHPRNIFDFLEHHRDARVVALEENFRSTGTIVQAADALIEHNSARLDRRLTTRNPEGTAIRLMCCCDEVEEAHFVAQHANSLVEEGLSYSDVGVLYRTNAQSRALEEAFIDERIPYRLVESVSFYQRAEIKDLLAYLRLGANPADQIAFQRIINVPRRGLGKVTTDAIDALAQKERMTLLEASRRIAADESQPPARRKALGEFNALIDALHERCKGPVEPALRFVIAQTGYFEYLQQASPSSHEEKRDNAGELVSAAASYDAEAGEPALAEFLERIALVSDADSFDPSAGAVSLMTLHTAKGLEFDAVFIVGLEEGLLPHQHSAESDDGLEEERRLLYVGITRAKRFLTLSCARNRTLYGASLPRYPSPFISELPNHLIVEARGEPDEPEPTEHDISRGDMVHHSHFGVGMVVHVEEEGEKLTIDFGMGNRKTIMVRYASMRKVSK
jgi:DNA helicase-2/ATP-dependent DNA helicase PcrA